ncbi:hypothetical protein LCGC14_1588780 [marine sediment metagenome]|uniref:Uncharacterized protein n=1 Tax=marine sediment metagenome TaxID=412755 RepID=A0A0F9IF06_9ZZZZ
MILKSSEMKMDDKTKIKALIIAAVLLIGILGFNYYSNYQEQKYNEYYNQGINDGLILILTEIQNKGYVQIPIGNQTIILGQYQGERNGS